MNLDSTEKLAEEVNETANALHDLMGDLPECINAPECTDGGVLS